MKKQRFMETSEFICTSCGQVFPLMRSPNQRCEAGYIKNLWCPYCHKDRKFLEVRQKGYYVNSDGTVKYVCNSVRVWRSNIMEDICSMQKEIYRCINCGFEGEFISLGLEEEDCLKLKCPECGLKRNAVEMTPLNFKPIDISPEHWRDAEDGLYP